MSGDATAKALGIDPTSLGWPPAEPCGCSLQHGRCDRHADMMEEIHRVWTTGSEAAGDIIWALSDGYGEAGYVPDQGYDWSGIRDSSVEAIEAMHAAIHA